MIQLDYLVTLPRIENHISFLLRRLDAETKVVIRASIAFLSSETDAQRQDGAFNAD